MHGMLMNLAGQFQRGIVEAQKDDIKDELPPSLVPKTKVELAGLKQSMAGLDLSLGDGWQGDVKEELKKANDCFQSANAFLTKFTKKLRDAAKELDEQFLAREMKGERND